MPGVTISWDLLIPNWVIGGIVFALVWRATRQVQSPWLRHLPRAAVGGITFFPSLLIANRDEIVPAVMALFVFLGQWPTSRELCWAFLPSLMGSLAWWLIAGGLAQLRRTSPLPIGRLTRISLTVFPLTLVGGVVAFFAVPKVEIDSIIAIVLFTGTTLALGGLTGGALATVALVRREQPKWRAATALALNGLAFVLGLSALGWLFSAR
jgi:hypothetical protein